MKKKTIGLIGLVMAAAAGLVRAEIFICKDAAGRTITSDRPIMECSDRKVRVLGKNGLTKREIQAPLTEEQKRQLQAEEEKRKAAVAALEEQRRQDRALLARYSKESDIEEARRHALEQIKEHIQREAITIAAAEKRLASARAEAVPYKNGKGIPPYIAHRISDNEQTIADGKKHIAEREAEMVKVNARHDEALKRFRELTPATTAKAQTN